MKHDIKLFDRGNGRGQQMVEGNFVFGIGPVSQFEAEADRAMRGRQRNQLNAVEVEERGGGGGQGGQGQGGQVQGGRDDDDDDDEYGLSDLGFESGSGGGGGGRPRVRSHAPPVVGNVPGRIDEDGVPNDGASASAASAASSASLEGARGAAAAGNGGNGGSGGSGGPLAQHHEPKGTLWTDFIGTLSSYQNMPASEPTSAHLVQLMRLRPLTLEQLASMIEGSQEELTADAVTRIVTILRSKMQRT